MRQKLFRFLNYVLWNIIPGRGNKKKSGILILIKLKIISFTAAVLFISSTLVAQTSFIHATGGIITTDGDYKIHTFTGGAIDSFTVTSGSGSATILVVAGGGGGGSATYWAPGGGGAGGMVEHAGKFLSTGIYNVIVGAGGSGGYAGAGNYQFSGTNGGNSVFDSITANGGGYGAEGYGDEKFPGPGGSGGGGTWGSLAGAEVGGLGTQGNSGGGIGYGNPGGDHGGGGGGAGSAGGYGFAGTAGDGRSNSITGFAVTYAAGGIGGLNAYQLGQNGAANSGNGGEGTNQNAGQGGTGGSGVVIIRYQYQSYDSTTVWDSDALKFIAAAVITDNVQKVAVNNLVIQLKSAGVWNKMKAIYPFAGGTANSHRYNLKDTSAFNLTFSGTWRHSSTGADPDGATAYADTHLTPSVTLSTGNTHISYYSTENTGSGNKSEIGQYDDTSHALLLNVKDNSGNLSAAGYLSTNPLTISNQSSEGFYINNILSGTHNVFKNGSEVITSSSLSGAPPSTQIRIGGSPNNSKYSDRECAFASIGDGLTGTESSALNTAVNNYETSLSRNVTILISSSQWITSGSNIYYNAGNVGIGISSPQAKLHVNGNIFSSGKVAIGTTDTSKIGPYSLAVNGSAIFTKAVVKGYVNWADYVFDKDFKLPALSEIEKYIKLNNHLPEVPTSDEVAKNGIDIGLTQALLLKKIEELTLFAIEQEKKIKALEEKIEKITRQK